ncbi:MAG: hypothetical protein K8S55_07835 [Phycisphaerae bacterium]|nr:hypothetical protein [Phycisphaerae bacterium]
MIQCKDCEYFHRGEDGEISFECDPFGTVKEPECLAKWQLIKINQMVASYQSTLRYYEKLAPMQEKMFRIMETEMDGMSEADKWKVHDDDEDEDEDHDDHDDHEDNDWDKHDDSDSSHDTW